MPAVEPSTILRTGLMEAGYSVLRNQYKESVLALIRTGWQLSGCPPDEHILRQYLSSLGAYTGLAVFMGSTLPEVFDQRLMKKLNATSEVVSCVNDALIQHVEQPWRDIATNQDLIRHLETQAARFADTHFGAWKPPGEGLVRAAAPPRATSNLRRPWWRRLGRDRD